MNAAHKFKEIDPQAALEGYNDAFNLLIDMAGKYACEQEAEKDIQVLRAKAEVLFKHSKDYLKRDSTASTILNEMGLLFMEMGELDNAKQKFMESMEYIPDGEDYSEPADNLEKLILMTQPEEEETLE